MSPNTITMIDRNRQKAFSFKSVQWLIHESERTDARIQHARNGGGVPVKLWNRVHYPDGYVRSEDGGRDKVFDF